MGHRIAKISVIVLYEDGMSKKDAGERIAENMITHIAQGVWILRENGFVRDDRLPAHVLAYTSSVEQAPDEIAKLLNEAVMRAGLHFAPPALGDERPVIEQAVKREGKWEFLGPPRTERAR
jgi:hypothetical protein